VCSAFCQPLFASHRLATYKLSILKRNKKASGAIPEAIELLLFETRSAFKPKSEVHVCFLNIQLSLLK
jgi:hypothetical protein